MTKRLFVTLSLLSLVSVKVISTAHALEFPEPRGFVNDFANILSSAARQNLEQKLTQLEQDSTIEITVVTVESLGGTTIEEYAVKLFENWQIGKKDQDNGVLLLIAPNERELRVEVGYGLEPVLTDSQAGRIIRNIITPEFKKGDYDTGVVNGVAAITKIVHGEAVDLDGEESDGDGVWILFVIGAIFLSYLSSFLARSKRFWPGGVLGAVLGVVLGIFLASLLISVLAAVGLGIFGLIFDYFLSKNYKKRKSRGLSTSWWGSGGGFFSGGGGGGGFGGFGGGSSGGGGASGRW